MVKGKEVGVWHDFDKMEDDIVEIVGLLAMDLLNRKVRDGCKEEFRKLKQW